MGDEQEPVEYEDDDQFQNDDEDLATYLPSITKQEVPEAERIIESLRQTLSTKRLHKDTVCPQTLYSLILAMFNNLKT